MELLGKKPIIFGVRDVPPEIVARRRKYAESRERAREYFDAIYGERATSALLANIIAAYTKKFRKSPSSFEEAWSKLGYQETTEIIFRAVNHLSCSAKDTGEMEKFLNQKRLTAIRRSRNMNT